MPGLENLVRSAAERQLREEPMRRSAEREEYIPRVMSEQGPVMLIEEEKSVPVHRFDSFGQSSSYGQ